MLSGPRETSLLPLIVFVALFQTVLAAEERVIVKSMPLPTVRNLSRTLRHQPA